MPFVLVGLVMLVLAFADKRGVRAGAGADVPPAAFIVGERAYSALHGLEVLIEKAAHGSSGWAYRVTLPGGVAEVVRERQLRAL
jgi:hypothetical protein